jgi:RNA polymerase sigma-70 factor (ECF subfamily)
MENHSFLDKSDEELVQLTLRNKDNFTFLIKRYEKKLLSYLHRISNVNSDELEDILQETFIKAYYNLNDFDQSLKFSSWIYRIAHNEAINNFRKNKARPHGHLVDLEDRYLERFKSNIDILQEINAQDLKKEINATLSRLELKYKEVLVLKFLEEKSYEEISDILKKPLGTVGTLISRAKKQFKKEFRKN